MRSLVVLLSVLLATLFAPVAVATDDLLLPNLVAFPASDIRLEVSSGKKLLRFSTLSGNLTTASGVTRGPLELRGGEVLRQSRKQKVYQRVYLEGGYQDRLVGEFVYHPGHRHFHFEGYARYELQPLDAPGGSERTGSKTSFCIMDTTLLDLSLPGAPKTAVYSTCGSEVQGMSIGWGDKYSYRLAGQEIDVTGLPDGTYRLRITIDPQRRLLESTTADNTSEVLVQLAGTKVLVVQ